MKTLLLDTGFSVLPIHDYLIGLGHEVWTIGNRAHDPLALARPDYWIEGDYSDVELVNKHVQMHNFDALVPGCTDVSMATFARVGLQPHYRYSTEADQIINRKLLFRQLCDKLGLPAPRAVRADALPNKGCYICKPADSFSGRGTTVFEASDRSAASEAIAHAKRHSPGGQVVCEEYVEGQLYSYSAFLEGGAVADAYIVREGSRHDAFAVDTSYLVDDYDPSHERVLREAVEAVCSHLNLCDGLLHTQFIDAGDKIAIIEMTRRCPGDLYSKLIEYSTNQPYAARYASYFVGQSAEKAPTHRRHILRHTIKQKGMKHFRGVELDPGLGWFQILPVVPPGELLDPSRFSRVGIAFIEAPNADELKECYDKIVTKLDKTIVIS